MTKLEQLRTMTTVVADTGDLAAIRQYHPQDATTNPSLLLKTLQSEETSHFFAPAIADARTAATGPLSASDVADRLAVRVGTEILSIVPGVVSTEVDARLSFDTSATLAKARKLAKLYERAGIERDRILIKIAATWEGIQAAQQLEQEGIHCNLTLLFGFPQAVACAEAKVTLISPFVGRILDWYKAHTGKANYLSEEDPGVVSVKRIYNYYKHYSYNTVVMGASFRNIGEIEALAGCDRLTISPALLEQLCQQTESLTRKLSVSAISCTDTKRHMDEKNFRWEMNQDAMATEKLAEGIRQFTIDQEKLEVLIRQKIV